MKPKVIKKVPARNAGGKFLAGKKSRSFLRNGASISCVSDTAHLAVRRMKEGAMLAPLSRGTYNTSDAKASNMQPTAAIVTVPGGTI